MIFVYTIRECPGTTAFVCLCSAPTFEERRVHLDTEYITLGEYSGDVFQLQDAVYSFIFAYSCAKCRHLGPSLAMVLDTPTVGVELKDMV